MADNDLAEVVALLQRKRSEHLAQVEQIDKALAALAPVIDAATTTHSAGPKPAPNVRTSTPSIRTKALQLMGEADRDWSAREIFEEYKRRGDPLHGKDPRGSVRTALLEAMRVGLAVRVAPGRYKATKYATSEPGEVTPLRLADNRG